MRVKGSTGARSTADGFTHDTDDLSTLLFLCLNLDKNRFTCLVSEQTSSLGHLILKRHCFVHIVLQGNVLCTCYFRTKLFFVDLIAEGNCFMCLIFRTKLLFACLISEQNSSLHVLFWNETTLEIIFHNKSHLRLLCLKESLLSSEQKHFTCAKKSFTLKLDVLFGTKYRPCASYFGMKLSRKQSVSFILEQNCFYCLISYWNSFCM